MQADHTLRSQRQPPLQAIQGQRPGTKNTRRYAPSLRSAVIAATFVATFGLHQAAAQDDPALQHSIEQLRSSVGQWRVTTHFMKPDGSVAKSVDGSYEFSWVVPDKLVSGKSEIPALKQVSAILFYVNEKQKKIEMVSVGADGALWVMTGPLGQEVRTSPEFPTAAGGKGMLRFTRFGVAADKFESRMDYTEDGGVTWQPGNHQVFRRAKPSAR